MFGWLVSVQIHGPPPVEPWIRLGEENTGRYRSRVQGEQLI